MFTHKTCVHVARWRAYKNREGWTVWYDFVFCRKLREYVKRDVTILGRVTVTQRFVQYSTDNIFTYIDMHIANALRRTYKYKYKYTHTHAVHPSAISPFRHL